MRFKKLSLNYVFLGIVLLMLTSMTVEGNYLLLFTFGWFASPDQRTPVCERPIQFSYHKYREGYTPCGFLNQLCQ